MGIIIVVEDEFITSEYLSGILTDKGYSVIAVANADNAIEMLETRDDVRMLNRHQYAGRDKRPKLSGHCPRPMAADQNHYNYGKRAPED